MSPHPSGNCQISNLTTRSEVIVSNSFIDYYCSCKVTFLVVCFLCIQCIWNAGRAQTPLFQLLSPKQTNVKFSNDINETENLNVLSYEYFYNGGGVAVGDINNDGLPDLLFSGNMKPNRLYINLGGIRFKDITKEAGAGLEGRKGGWKTGVTMADINGDGLLDIYICYSGKGTEDARRNQLFINQGNLKFTEQAKEYGLDDPGYSTQAAFFDYDNDGDLDMFLLNHNVKKYDNLELAKFRNETDEFAGSKLFENLNGGFVDVSKKAGIHQYPLTFGLGIAIADINQDGFQDIYVTNDYNEPDYMYINNGQKGFNDETQHCLRHLPQFSMGVDIADINNDGLPDIMNLDMLPEDNRRQKLLQLQENYEYFQLMTSQDLYKQYMHNMLQLNNGDGTFSEIAQLAGVSNTDWSWCPLLADFDNDGYKDLFITNGYLRDYTNKDFLKYWGDYKFQRAVNREPFRLMNLINAMPSTTLPNYIYKNGHDLTFTNKQKEWGLDKPCISNGAVYADLDNDGDLDLVVNNINEPASVYKNTTREQSHSSYLAIHLKGKSLNTQAIGAKVYVYTKGMRQYQEVNPSRGYLSCVSTVLNFGLDTLQKVDSVKIIWPDNQLQVLSAIPANQQLEISENPRTLTNGEIKDPVSPVYFTKVPPIIKYKQEEFDENDFKRQLLMLFMYSKTGPVMATGDVNKDGLEDLFISGDKNKPGKVYIQQPGGKFNEIPDLTIGNESTSTVSAAAFLDANGDGYDDLYIGKGGYALWEPHTPALQDELYINDGKGNLQLQPTALPDLTAASKSCIRPCDYDNDGDCDIFVGGRIIPGKYPLAPESYLLINNGKGQFSVAKTSFSNMGMVTDAQWVDLNKDGRKDLVVCGEFMPVTVFINTSNGFIDQTKDYFEAPENGFWSSLAIADLDGDGTADIIAGNLGLNTQIRASREKPAEMYYADFDANGSIDPFFNFYIQGKSYPFVSRDELNEQIYSMRKTFSSYNNYSNATMENIFSRDQLEKAGKLVVNELRTVCFMNKNGKYKKTELPLQAQFSMVTKIFVRDFDKDGYKDILLLGNHSDNRLKIGSIDANYGCFLKGSGNGSFTYVNQPKSGLSVAGDVKSAEEMVIDGANYLVIGSSNEALQFYRCQ